MTVGSRRWKGAKTIMSGWCQWWCALICAYKSPLHPYILGKGGPSQHYLKADVPLRSDQANLGKEQGEGARGHSGAPSEAEALGETDGSVEEDSCKVPAKFPLQVSNKSYYSSLHARVERS